MQEVRFTDIDDLYFRGKWAGGLHAHPCHELGLCLSGRHRVEVGGRELEVQAGDLIFYPAGTTHRERTEGRYPMHVCYVHFECAGFPIADPVRLADAGGRIRVLMDWLFAEKRTRTPLTAELTHAIMQSLATQLVRLFRYPDVGLVADTRQHVRAHLDAPQALGELAARAGMSKFHFLRTYKRLAGRTPMQDVRFIRLETARQLVMTTALPLKTIAARVGFRDYCHMVHVFQRTLHTTPGQYRLNTRRRRNAGARG